MYTAITRGQNVFIVDTETGREVRTIPIQEPITSAIVQGDRLTVMGTSNAYIFDTNGHMLTSFQL